VGASRRVCRGKKRMAWLWVVAAVVVERERVARNEGWSASSTLPPLPDENGEAPSLAKSLFPWREQEIASRRAA
jgi:hypothetical protein